MLIILTHKKKKNLEYSAEEMSAVMYKNLYKNVIIKFNIYLSIYLYIYIYITQLILSGKIL